MEYDLRTGRLKKPEMTVCGTSSAAGGYHRLHGSNRRSAQWPALTLRSGEIILKDCREGFVRSHAPHRGLKAGLWGRRMARMR